jgi:hypothetical protein
MSKSILITMSLACGVVFGAGIDRYMMLDSRTTEPVVTKVAEVRTGGIAAPVQLQPVQLQPAKTTSATLDSSQMRAMLREELGTALTAALAGVSSSSTASKLAIAPAAAPKQQQEALLAASEIIDGGQWGEQERNSFHQKLGALDPEMREQAMQRLVQAIDSGALKSPNGGPALL